MALLHPAPDEAHPRMAPYGARGWGRVLRPWARVSVTERWRPRGHGAVRVWGRHSQAGASGSPRGQVPTCRESLGKATAAGNGMVARCDGRLQGSLGHGSLLPAGTLRAAAPSNPMCCSPVMGPLLCPGGTARLVALVPKSTRKLGLHLQHGGGHQIKDPWAVGWWQEGRKGNHRGPEAAHRQEVIHTKCWGADELSSPKGQSWGSLAPELRFHGMRRRSGGSQGLSQQT